MKLSIAMEMTSQHHHEGNGETTTTLYLTYLILRQGKIYIYQILGLFLNDDDE